MALIPSLQKHHIQMSWNMWFVKRLSLKPKWPGCYLAHDWYAALQGAHQWVNMWPPRTENIIPEFDAEEASLDLLLWISHVDSSEAVSLPPGDIWATSESTAPVILHPSSPSFSPVINDWIRANDSHRDPLQEGGYYADIVGEPQTVIRGTANNMLSYSS